MGERLARIESRDVGKPYAQSQRDIANTARYFEFYAGACDKIAGEVKFAEFTSMSTVVKAISIGGERGGQMRDNESLKPQIARYRELQAKARKACFIGPPQ